MRDASAVSPGLWVIGSVSVVLVVAVTGFAVWTGFWGLGTPADRAAANRALQQTAALLGGRYRDRKEYPYLWRPSQYGGIDGEAGGLGDLEYELLLMPRNAEDNPGAARLRIGSRQGPRLAGGRPGMVIYIPERIWHWPDRADPALLADQVRQVIATVDAGGEPTWDDPPA